MAALVEGLGTNWVDVLLTAMASLHKSNTEGSNLHWANLCLEDPLFRSKLTLTTLPFSKLSQHGHSF